MKLITALIILAIPLSAAAERAFETKEQATERRAAEQYQQYEDNDYQQPLGGYSGNTINEPIRFDPPDNRYETQRAEPYGTWQDRAKR